MLSEFDDPVSEALCKSGAAAVPTVVVKDIAETVDVFVSESSTITYAL
jgi:hypothetical protein